MLLWACLLLLPTLLRADLSNYRCGEPSDELTRYGTTKGSERPTGGFLTIFCHIGDAKYLNCDQNNHWQTVSGPCPVPTCSDAKLPSESDTVRRIKPARNQLNDIATFRCARGLLGGSISFMCQKKPGKKIRFHWKPQNRTAEGKRLRTPTCTKPAEPSCQYSDTPHRKILSEELTHGRHLIVEDDELTLGCDPGYKLNGDSFVYCDMDGIWSPPELPQCEEMRCELPEREHLTAKLDGTDTVLSTGTNITHNQKVALECEKGYRLDGSALVTCNSHWQPRKIPSCQAIRCPSIEPPEHGERVVLDNPLLEGTWRVGSSVRAGCSDGYTLLGTRRRFCTTAGSWNGTLQICDNGRSTCKSPGRPIGGMKHGERYNKGDKVTFSCSTGRTMLGSTERVCLDNGEWTGDETRCIAANEHMTMEEAMLRLGSGLTKISEKSIDTKLQKDKLRNLMGKEVLLGKNKMKDMNPNMRSTIKELRDNGGIDVYFVLDTSGSIPRATKNTSVEIIKKLVRLVGVSADNGGTGFGFLAFDSEVWETVAVGERTETENIIQFLDGFKARMIARATGGTAPATAFAKLKALINTRLYSGEREMLKDRASAIILLSDGIKNEGGDPVTIRNELIGQAKLWDHEIHVYCIGVGDTKLDLLNQLATKGTDYLVFLKDLSELQEVVGTIYNGNTSFGHCGVQGHQTTYKEDASAMWAVAGTWRWVGGLFYYRGIPPAKSEDQFLGSEFICGVSLISKGPNETQSDWALTAAHCVPNTDASKLMVKFGSLTSSKTLQEGTVVHVERVLGHPDYVGATMLHDVALLKLKEKIPFAHDVRPVCLHKPTEDPIEVNTRAKMTGWGWLTWDNKTISPTLKQLSVKIQTDESCTHSTRDTEKAKFTRPFNFCAGNVTVAGMLLDACKKDSGSPLVECHEQGDLKRVCTQVGIVSFGDKCGKEGKYGVYTNVTTYFNWINNTMHLN